MIHEIHPVGPISCNCSILGDEESREAVVVDPGGDATALLMRLHRLQLKVTQILLTHSHIDHVGGAMELRRESGAPILMHGDDLELLRAIGMQAQYLGLPTQEPVTVDQNLADGDVIEFGGRKIEVLHTPGHTLGSVCFYLRDEAKLLSGDTLFCGSVGRTDLPGAAPEKIMPSIHDKLMTLPDATEVFPGHGPVTSIGDERTGNPYILARWS